VLVGRENTLPLPTGVVGVLGIDDDGEWLVEWMPRTDDAAMVWQQRFAEVRAANAPISAAVDIWLGEWGLTADLAEVHAPDALDLRTCIAEVLDELLAAPIDPPDVGR